MDDRVHAVDPFKELHPDTIERYYGVEGPIQVRHPGQTGAGHPDDEDEDEWVDEADEYRRGRRFGAQHMASGHQRGTASQPVPLERNGGKFLWALGEIVQLNLVPEGYGVIEDEWEDGSYPSMEAINPGTRGKEIVVELPRDIWLPRAVLFAQGLDALEHSLELQPVREDGGDDVSSSSSQEDID
ncbi:hypothetical protein C8R46DRAFT_915629 [Mycena filopes]|nr:hypothetical protein C8R46DRAFT_915629 [Mycena filopes]